MSKLISLLLFSLLITGQDAQAQVKAVQKFRFGTTATMGMLEGEAGTSFLIDVTGGFKYKTWYGGIGTGLDYYSVRSIPVFFSVTRYLSSKPGSFYLQGDAGLNFAWQEKRIPGWGSNDISNKFNPGAYWNTTLGFAMGLDRNSALLFGLGYSCKYLKETKEIAVFCINPPCENAKEIYRYNLRRLNVRLGWRFNQ